MQEIDQMEENVQQLYVKRREELERISALTSEEAKEILLGEVRKEVSHEAALMIKDIESKLRKRLIKKLEKL